MAGGESLDGGGFGLGIEGRFSGEHGEEHAAEAVEIAAGIDFFAAGLFGGHEVRRAGQDARAG